MKQTAEKHQAHAIHLLGAATEDVIDCRDYDTGSETRFDDGPRNID